MLAGNNVIAGHVDLRMISSYFMCCRGCHFTGTTTSPRDLVLRSYFTAADITTMADIRARAVDPPIMMIQPPRPQKDGPTTFSVTREFSMDDLKKKAKEAVERATGVKEGAEEK